MESQAAVAHYGFNASLFWWFIEENATTTGTAPCILPGRCSPPAK